ncbi:alpha/beta hydrolase [Pelagicoccus albus]|uniref:Alpha/beta hydrolase n=1 Tax=Pelagicoccus albus TaxID=415222 RepID=A0A7X1B9E6_9BACT|nr:alpha/beta hydrolase [Pelagicoccus albus]MBC2608125.1 alpha/beta hydrolase [Pelagicoccus albus]
MRERERRNGFNTILVLVALCVLFFYLFAQMVTKQLLFVPGPSTYQADDDFIQQVVADDGIVLSVYWQKVPGATKTVFYTHGNGEDIGQTLFILQNYALQGVNVLSFDYRGYGLSEGTPSEKNCYSDARDVIEHAVQEWGVDRNWLILHGRSLGGGVAVQLATEFQPLAVILESTFLSIYQLYLPLSWVPGDKFVNEDKAPEVSAPALVIHGREDRVVPFEQGLELSQALGSHDVKTVWVDGVGHNDLVVKASSEYWAAIRSFLANL